MDKTASSSQDPEIRKGPWTMEEDLILINYIANHGEGVWNTLARSAGRSPALVLMPRSSIVLCRKFFCSSLFIPLLLLIPPPPGLLLFCCRPEAHRKKLSTSMAELPQARRQKGKYHSWRAASDHGTPFDVGKQVGLSYIGRCKSMNHYEAPLTIYVKMLTKKIQRYISLFFFSSSWSLYLSREEKAGFLINQGFSSIHNPLFSLSSSSSSSSGLSLSQEKRSWILLFSFNRNRRPAANFSIYIKICSKNEDLILVLDFIHEFCDAPVLKQHATKKSIQWRHDDHRNDQIIKLMLRCRIISFS